MFILGLICATDLTNQMTTTLTPTNYILIFTALFLGACAIFAPYIAEMLKRKAFAPKIKILFELAPPFCHKTTWRSPPHSQIRIEEPVYYFRFLVVNEGKSQARLCEVVLENLWIYDSANKPQLFSNFSPLNMRWDVEPPTDFININPERRVFCNIGHISSAKYQEDIERKKCVDVPGYRGSDLRFKLDLLRTMYAQPNCFPPGRYSLEFGLYSENAGCQKAFFDISWSGIWQDSVSEMFREIVIALTGSHI